MNRKCLAAAAALLILAAGAVPFACNGNDGVIRGLTVDGMQAGGMTEDELVSLINEKNKKIESRSLTVQHGAIKEVWSFKDFGVRMDPAAEAERILADGRSGNFLSNWLEQWKALLGGDSTHLVISYDEKAMEKKVADLVARYGMPPIDSAPTIRSDGSVTFSEGKPYIKIDEGTLKALVHAQFLSGNEGTVEIPVLMEKGPSITAEMRKQINRVLGVYTTYFSQSPNRSSNIEKAARSIDAWVIQPGESFSFNQATGLRTKENGYLDAPVFMDGKLVPDAGGGVCQVSTTLFNSVMLAGLQVTQRTCHFGPVAYAPIGRDATVADHYLDFCFRNNLTHPIYVCAAYAPGQITTYILGNEADVPASVSITETANKTLPHKTVLKADPAQKEDKKVEEGNDGYDVTIAQRVVRKDGSTYSDTFRSVYDAVDTVITYKDPKVMEEAKKKSTESGA